MNVFAAALNKWLAIPCLRWANGTNRRGMPSGVGIGAGWQKRPVLVSTATSAAVGGVRGASGEVPHAASQSADEAISIAVDIRWAITHPAIFSREVVEDGRRNRYALDTCSVEGPRGGEESVRLIVSSKDVS